MAPDERLRHALGRVFAGAYHDVACAATLLKEQARLAPQSCEAHAHAFCMRALRSMHNWQDEAGKLLEAEGAMIGDRTTPEVTRAAGIAGTDDAVPE